MQVDVAGSRLTSWRGAGHLVARLEGRARLGCCGARSWTTESGVAAVLCRRQVGLRDRLCALFYAEGIPSAGGARFARRAAGRCSTAKG